MSRIILLIAVCALICLCRADVSEIKNGFVAANEILVPFNDLLPPLVDESSTTSTTTTTTSTTTTTTTTVRPETTKSLAITKPTKKSYYQQTQQLIKTPQQQQQQPLIDNNVSEVISQKTKEQLLQSLSLDLLPPFEEAATNVIDSPPVVAVVPAPTQRPTASPTYRPTAAPTHRPTAAPTHRSTAVPTHRPIAAPHPPVPVVPVVHRTSNNFNTHRRQEVHRFSAIPQTGGQISKFSTYFHSTTLRPRRGPLPTLTPFPRHHK